LTKNPDNNSIISFDLSHSSNIIIKLAEIVNLVTISVVEDRVVNQEKARLLVLRVSLTDLMKIHFI